MKPATSRFLWILAILFSAMSSASAALPAAGCSDTLLVLADQLVQSGRVQLSGGIGKTQGSSACAMPSSPPAFTASSVEKAIPWNQLGVVDTSFHGQVVVRSGGTLLLKPGVYRFGRLTVEWDAKIQVDSAGSTAESALEIQVGSGLTWMDRSKLVWPGKADSVAATKVMIAVLGGAVQVGYDSRFLGTLFAPQSNVAIQDRAVVVGRVLAAVQAWGWDSKGWFRRTDFCPSWLLAHEVKIVAPRRFWVRTASMDISWTVDGVRQDSALVERWSQEGGHWVRRCHAGVCDSVKAMVDWTPPVVRIVSPTTEYVTNNSRLPLIWTADANATTEMVDLVDGANLLTRYATDSAGNRDSASVRVVLDRIPPVVRILQPVSGALTNRSRMGVVWSVDGVTKNPDTSDLQEGSNWIRRSAQDAAGNIGSDSVQVELDTHPPVVAFQEPASGTQTAAAQILVRWKVDTARFEQWVDLDVGSNRIERTGVDAAGNSASASIVVVRTGEPVLPEPVAPAYPTTRNSDLSFGADFLFKGDHAVQTGFQEDSVLPFKRAVLRGVVVDPSGKALPNVRVRVLGTAKFGETRTRATGVWDLVVEGDAKRMVVFEKDGFHSSQREMLVSRGDIALLDTVALVPFDTMVTAIRSGAEAVQVVMGSTVQDKDGIRQSVVFIPSGTDLTVEAMDGTRTSLGTARMRITEYTVGERGPQAMPADMPPTVDYTFCADVTVDEAPQANHIQFSKPVPFYVENFLGLPVGWPVPVGSYDRKAGAWKELPNGRIIKIVGVDPSGLARVDMTGDGAEDPLDSLAKLGFTSEERKSLAQKYPVGQSLMRAVSSSFSPIDLNWPVLAPIKLPILPPDPPDPEPSTCPVAGCEIDVENRWMRETIRVPGTDLDFTYSSERADGRIAERVVRFRLWDGLPSSDLVSLDLAVIVAGKKISIHKDVSEIDFTKGEIEIIWDGFDAWGRKVYGDAKAVAELVYNVNRTYYFPQRGGFLNSGSGVVSSRVSSRSIIPSRIVRNVRLRGWAPEGVGESGGWQLEGLNSAGQDSAVRNENGWMVQNKRQGQIRLIAGGGQRTDSSGLAKEHQFTGLASIAVDRGIVYAIDVNFESKNGGIWRVFPDGKIERFLKLGSIPPGKVGDTITFRDIETRWGAEPENAWSIRGSDDAGILYVMAMGVSSYTLYKIDIDKRNMVRVCSIPDGIWQSWTYVKGRGIVYFTVNTNTPPRDSTWGVWVIGVDGIPKKLGGAGPYKPTQELLRRGIPIDSLELDLSSLVGAPNGDIYAADFTTKMILRIDRQGMVTKVVGGGSAWYPNVEGPVWADSMSFHGMGLDNRFEWATENWSVDENGAIFIKAMKSIENGVYITHHGSDHSKDSAQNGWELRDSMNVSDVGWAYCGQEGCQIAQGPNGEKYFSVNGGGPWDGSYNDKPAIWQVIWNNPSLGAKHFRLDSLNRHVATMDDFGRVRRQFAYDAQDRVVAVTDSLGRTTRILRNAQGQIVEFIAPDGRRTEIVHNGVGQIEAIHLPDGRKWAFTWNANGLAKSITNPQGQTSQYLWDSLGRLLEDRRDDGAVLSLRQKRTYRLVQDTLIGRMGETRIRRKETLADGSVRIQTTDELGRVSVSRITPWGATTDSSWDGSVHFSDDHTGRDWRPDGTERSTTTRSSAHEYADPRDPSSTIWNADTVRNDQGVSITKRLRTGGMVIYTSPEGTVDTAWHDGRGLEVARHRPGTGKRHFDHDANGNVIRERAYLAGQEYTLWEKDFDASSNLLEERKAIQAGQPLVVVARHTYDSRGWRTATVNGRGERTEYVYDAKGNLVSETNPRGARIVREYDVRGRVVALWDAEEMAKPLSARRAVRMVYDFEDREISRTDKFGLITKTEYFPDGRVQRQVAGADTVAFHYNAQGQKIRETDARGRSTLFEYNQDGLQTGTLWKVGGSLASHETGDRWETNTLDGQGREVAIARNGIRQWARTYDRFGRLLSESDSRGRLSKYLYDTLGRKSVVLADGRRYQTLFDEWGRVVGRLRDQDTLEVLRLALDGSVLESRRPGSGSEWFALDAAGSVVRREDSTGQSMTRLLAVGGLDSVTTDGLGRSQTRTSDLFGRVISGRDARGYLTRFGYDEYGELAWLEDHEGNRTRFETLRWQAGTIRRQVKTHFPDGKSESASYGAEGELLRRVDGNGVQTDNKYDRWGQLVEITYRNAQGVPLADTIRFRYDDFGRLVHARRGLEADSAEYDPQGRLVRELQTIAGATFEVSHTYEADDRIRATRLPDGSIVRRSVREGSGVDSLWLGSALMADFRYQFGRETSRHLKNGIEAHRVYDAGGRLSGLGYIRNSTTLAGFGFGFDPVGNLGWIQRSHEAKGDEAMQYTADHQLEGWNRGTLNSSHLVDVPQASQSWQLDSRGNWTGWSGQGWSETRTHTVANELAERRVGVVGTSFAWDSAGNLVSDGKRTFHWNPRGQLESVSLGTVDQGRYGYDPLGRRTWKKVAGLTTLSVYDGWQCIWQKVTGSGIDTTRAFLYGNYIDEPIAMIRSWGTTSDTVWYLQGNNYNVEALTDHTGAIVERYAYTPYGEPTVYTAAGTDGKWFTSDDVTASVSAKGSALTFQGRELDAETGVYYFRNRYYSAQMGRFVSRDPIRNSKSLISLFRMELGDPFKFIDPDGKNPVFSKKKCMVTVSLKLTLAFSPDPQPDGDFDFLGPWNTAAQNQFKSRVKSTAESFFNNQNYRCDKCCDCPSGASGKLSISFGSGGAYVKVLDAVDAEHRESSFEWSKRVVEWEDGAGGDPFSILIHEIGHLLGLGHPGDGPGVVPNSIESYTADISSIMGQGNQFREADFKKIFCSNIKCGK